MNASDHPPQPAGVRTGNDPGKLPNFPGFSRVEPLGRGGMGTVLRAWQDDLGRPVAVKLLRAELRADESLRERFRREAHILAGLEHPGIVTVHHAGEGPDGPYYVMRLVEGASIDRALAGRSASEIAAAFHGVAEALAAAHQAGVLHRDIKPDNVLVEPGGRAVLVDFGLATRAGPGVGGEGLAGTPDYLAPELLAGTPAAPAADIYALGATLYATLTGRVPFPATELHEKLRAIREDDPPLPRTLRPDVPKPLQAICLKALERLPADRYASAEDLARDLERFTRGDVVQALPVRSRSLLRRKLELQIAEHRDWVEQGLIDAQQQAALQHACEHVDELGRGLLRGVLGSLPNLLLLAGILLCVFGPVLLLTLAWEQWGALGKLALPAAPLVLLAAVGATRWRAHDRGRALACLFGATLLVAPLAFVAADWVPVLRAVADDAGTLHPILPGELWLPPADAPAWKHAGFLLLAWKLLLTALATLAATLLLHARLRAAALLWIACLAGLGAAACAAPLAGWRGLPPGARWLLAVVGLLGVIAIGFGQDRRFARDRALPFYWLGFVALVFAVLNSLAEGLPLTALGVEAGSSTNAWAATLHGLAFLAGGVAAHFRGTPLLRQIAGAPLLVGFVLTITGLMAASEDGAIVHEILPVAACAGLLVAGLALHRNTLVLPAAITLPITIGSVAQRHVQALWAWSAAVVIGGALLVLLSFRLGARRDGGQR